MQKQGLTNALRKCSKLAGAKPPANGGQEGYVSRKAWTGWVACPGSFWNRRPRIAAPNPQGDSLRRIGQEQWLTGYNFRVPGY
jgi:hypothetical protein